MSAGILAGLMWLPFSGLIRHWVGLFHGLSRTVLIVIAWYLFPRHRFVVIPAIIVVIYLVTIAVLVQRAKRLPSEPAVFDALPAQLVDAGTAK